MNRQIDLVLGLTGRVGTGAILNLLSFVHYSVVELERPFGVAQVIRVAPKISHGGLYGSKYVSTGQTADYVCCFCTVMIRSLVSMRWRRSNRSGSAGNLRGFKTVDSNLYRSEYVFHCSVGGVYLFVL